MSGKSKVQEKQAMEREDKWSSAVAGCRVIESAALELLQYLAPRACNRSGGVAGCDTPAVSYTKIPSSPLGLCS